MNIIMLIFRFLANRWRANESHHVDAWHTVLFPWRSVGACHNSDFRHDFKVLRGDVMRLTRIIHILGTVVVVANAATAFGQDHFTQPAKSNHATVAVKDCVVTDASIGGISLGMTVGEARALYPNATFKREEDGEGVPYLSLVLNEEKLLWFTSGDYELVTSSEIDFVQTFNSKCHTANGIHPGITISSAEKIAGRVAVIVQSNVEMREFVEFNNQSSTVGFRIDYCGVYDNDSSTTKKYQPGCKITAVSVIERR